MDLEQLVRRAAQGDVKAFVAAWTALPNLAEPAAFPGWLRSIVRHRAAPVLRRIHLELLPPAAADQVASDQLPADDRLDQRHQTEAALAAIAELPTALREAAALFFLHECSHQDIAVFLGISATTVNNRLYGARAKLKERMLTMVTKTLHEHRLPDDFANRIGRLVEARGDVVEALFDPQSLPDLLTELAVSDEANKRAVTVRVIQRPGGVIVRGVTVSPIDVVPRGATVLNSLRHAETPIDQATFERVVTLLAGPPTKGGEAGKLLETGIKVIDVMCPLVAGGPVAIAGELGAGTPVVMEELVRRLSSGREGISLFTLTPQWSPVANRASRMPMS